MFTAVFECTLQVTDAGARRCCRQRRSCREHRHQMLVHNFSDYPDHRHAFYELLEVLVLVGVVCGSSLLITHTHTPSVLQALVTHQFVAVLLIAQQSGQHFKLIVDSIVWGLKVLAWTPCRLSCAHSRFACSTRTVWWPSQLFAACWRCGSTLRRCRVVPRCASCG